MSKLLPFGFVTGCHAGDKFMVGATLASIRHFMPNVPICLVQDGDFDLGEITSLYHPFILRTRDLPDPAMRALVCGNQRAKLAAMWAGPFDSFVWIDADAIAWGDFTQQARQAVDFNIFWDEISIPADAGEPPSWLNHYYFDLKKLQSFHPDFEWRGLPYFCTGAFFCRRNAIPFADWMQAEEWLRIAPGLFKFGEMGMMNYLVHSLAQKGRLTVAMTDLQDIWQHHGRDELKSDCIGAGWDFPNSISRPRVAHFCGRKPNVLDRRSFSRPFTIARMKHYQTMGLSRISSWAAILKEDGDTYMHKACRKIGRGLGRKSNI